MFNRLIKTVLLTFLFTSSLAMADIHYVCINDSSERNISVVYTGASGVLPCEVQYKKATSYEVLWNATSDEGYCESKAAEFVAKQEGWGWSCVKQEETAPEDLTGEETSSDTE